jgi:RNA polymerase sigma-70 factor, ECF subfamily
MRDGEAEEEAGLVALVRAGALDAVATRAVERYGPELYGFLIHVLGSEADAADAYSQTIEDMWRGLPTFAARCSVRTWLYVLARHAASRHRRSPWSRGGRGGDAALRSLAQGTRSRTDPWLRTDIKDKWHALRESLDADDRTLLILRVDRDLGWIDIARVMLAEDAPGRDALAREAVRLRKRFSLLKEELRRRARAVGIVEEDREP